MFTKKFGSDVEINDDTHTHTHIPRAVVKVYYSYYEVCWKEEVSCQAF